MTDKSRVTSLAAKIRRLDTGMPFIRRRCRHWYRRWLTQVEQRERRKQLFVSRVRMPISSCLLTPAGSIWLAFSAVAGALPSDSSAST